MHPEKTELTWKKIAAFWLPLYSTWLMMSIEGPFIAAIIARLADAKFNLAAYGVAFSLGMIFESPIIMMLSASNVLVKDRMSFLKLRRFNNALNVLITFALLLVIIPPVFFWLTRGLIGLPWHVAKLTHLGTILLIPWPAAIGYRRFYQGILIGNHLHDCAFRLYVSHSPAALSFFNLAWGLCRRGRPVRRRGNGSRCQPLHGQRRSH
jgi:Na+-driven multidrug efflux pump